MAEDKIMRKYFAAIYRPVKMRINRLKLDYSPDVRRQFYLNMRRIYLALFKRGIRPGEPCRMVNPGIILNKNLSQANILGLSDQEILHLAENSRQLPEEDRYPLRTLPIAAWMIARQGIEKISYKTLREAFDRAMQIHSDLLKQDLPRRHPEKTSVTLINNHSINILVQSGLWRSQKLKSGRTLITNEFGYEIGTFEGPIEDLKPVKINEGHLWVD